MITDSLNDRKRESRYTTRLSDTAVSEKDIDSAKALLQRYENYDDSKLVNAIKSRLSIIKEQDKRYQRDQAIKLVLKAFRPSAYRLYLAPKQKESNYNVSPGLQTAFKKLEKEGFTFISKKSDKRPPISYPLMRKLRGNEVWYGVTVIKGEKEVTMLMTESADKTSRWFSAGGGYSTSIKEFIDNIKKLFKRDIFNQI